MSELYVSLWSYETLSASVFLAERLAGYVWMCEGVTLCLYDYCGAQWPYGCKAASLAFLSVLIYGYIITSYTDHCVTIWLLWYIWQDVSEWAGWLPVLDVWWGGIAVCVYSCVAVMQVCGVWLWASQHGCEFSHEYVWLRICAACRKKEGFHLSLPPCVFILTVVGMWCPPSFPCTSHQHIHISRQRRLVHLSYRYW